MSVFTKSKEDQKAKTDGKGDKPGTPIKVEDVSVRLVGCATYFRGDIRARKNEVFKTSPEVAQELLNIKVSGKRVFQQITEKELQAEAKRAEAQLKLTQAQADLDAQKAEFDDPDIKVPGAGDMTLNDLDVEEV